MTDQNKGQPGQGQQHGGQSRPMPDQQRRQQGGGNVPAQQQQEDIEQFPDQRGEPARRPAGTPDIEDPNEALDEEDNNRVV
jgi:hypothetical protein